MTCPKCGVECYAVGVKGDGPCYHDGQVKGLSRWADKREIDRISDRLAREEKRIKQA
jgi:hypothetical protein